MENRNRCFTAPCGNHYSRRELYDSESYGMVDLVLGGIDRVGTGFFFEPFDYYYMVTDERDSFYRDA
ncbi:MAG: hypothetical protein ACOC25_03630 [Alkalispirochaetaceae bacterium]